jgi:hypothetical protein
MKKMGFWVSVVFLLFLGASGCQSFFGDWGDVETLGQRICNIGQGVFGVFGLLAGIGAILKHRWAGSAALGFAVSGGITAGLASVAWGGSSVATGVGSGALGLLLGLVLYLGIGRPDPAG